MEINLTNPHGQMFRATLSNQRRADAVQRAHLEPWLVDLLGEDPPVPLDGASWTRNSAAARATSCCG